MKSTEQDLMKQFGKSVDAALHTIGYVQSNPAIVQFCGISAVEGLLNYKMRDVADYAGKLLYDDPYFGLDAYADFGNVISLASECLGEIDPAFERLTEKFHIAHYLLGILDVRTYKDDVDIQQETREPCPV